jgi:hypothetical protein
MISDNSKHIVSALKMVKTILSEQGVPGAEASALPPMEVAPKKKPTKVRFDSSTANPFEVVFSERGFQVEGTRMSFEELETAISKNYNIALNGGQGVTLDAVKMQKILKYKELY